MTRPPMSVVGAIERIELVDLDLVLACRIDTGARTSALHVETLQTAGNDVTFEVVGERRGRSTRVRFTTPVQRWARIRATQGTEERRAIVDLDVRLGDELFVVEVGLTDRAGMHHPMLLGRSALRGRYLVDVSRSGVLSSRGGGDR